MMVRFCVHSEFEPLTHVVMGLGRGYHRDLARVEIANATHQKTLDAHGHPAERQVVAEFAGFKAAMEAAGVRVQEPELASDNVQDQTCPRDIAFVIGDTLVTAGMRHAGRAEEIDAVRGIFAGFEGPQVAVPKGLTLEGGDVVVHRDLVFVGAGQRSDAEGTSFLAERFPDHRIVAVPTKGPSEGEEVLHLDCAFNPLGLGHALVYPDGLAQVPLEMRGFDWIEVTRDEAQALATNVLSVAPDHIIARDHPGCARVNDALRRAGYRVDEVTFDAVPSTGGSFRCATLPLTRAPMDAE
ncbi:MAG: arginine deiminase family protein [Pseudomonadota bacterium]